MSVQTERVPPVPQLVPPLRALQPVSIDLTTLRFDNSWMQWFTQVKYKIDTINVNVVGVSEVTGSGIIFRDDGTGVWRSGSINGTSGRIAVTNNNGLAGDPTIDFIDSGIRAVIIVSTVDDGDTTHSPSGDAVFDAIAASSSAAESNANAYTDAAVADRARVVPVPATATSTGTTGDIAMDATHFYVCHATDTWKRVAISTW